MNHYTNLSLSRKIASLGVECESEKVWAERSDKKGWYLERRCTYQYGCFPAYRLDELPPVLQAIGAVKGWGVQHHGRIAMHKCTRRCMPLWAEHFLVIARFYLDSPEKAWKYLSDLLDNN